MFGLLPRTRSIFKGNAVAFRINSANGSLQGVIEKDPRISAFDKDKARWFTFELSRGPDLHDALEYLRRAFEAACNSKKKK
jgi:hypothetical protein